MVATTTEQVSTNLNSYRKSCLQSKANSAGCNNRRCVRKLTFFQSLDLLTLRPHNILVVHPLVLLSVTDHHARSVARGSSKRVVGVLLGQDNGKSINVANSFGIPFEEDDKDAKTWFLDHNYVEGMFEMFKKVNGEYRLPICCTSNNTSLMIPSSLWPCSTGTHDRLVSHGAETSSIGFGD